MLKLLFSQTFLVVSAYGPNLQRLTVVFLAHLSLFFFVDFGRVLVGRAQAMVECAESREAVKAL